MIPSKPQKYVAKLVAKEKVSSKIYLLRLELVEPSTMEFLPGQTIMIHVAEGVNRSMSISSTTKDTHRILLTHDVAPMGPFSHWTIEAAIGDTISFMGPLGVFFMDATSQRSKVCVATGSGIAAFRGMMEEYLMRGGTDTVTLYWGLRYEEDIFWEKEFEALAATYPNFHYFLTLSKAKDTWSGKRGHVGDHLFPNEKNIAGTDFYLCGNKSMILDMKEKLMAAGVPVTQIKYELFY